MSTAIDIIMLLMYFIRSQDVLTKSIQKEVTVLASLHHPNIVKYHCAWLESIAPDLSNVTIVEHHESWFESGYYRNNELPSIPNNRWLTQHFKNVNIIAYSIIQFLGKLAVAPVLYSSKKRRS